MSVSNHEYGGYGGPFSTGPDFDCLPACESEKEKGFFEKVSDNFSPAFQVIEGRLFSKNEVYVDARFNSSFYRACNPLSMVVASPLLRVVQLIIGIVDWAFHLVWDVVTLSPVKFAKRLTLGGIGLLKESALLVPKIGRDIFRSAKATCSDGREERIDDIPPRGMWDWSYSGQRDEFVDDDAEPSDEEPL